MYKSARLTSQNTTTWACALDSILLFFRNFWVILPRVCWTRQSSQCRLEYQSMIGNMENESILCPTDSSLSVWLNVYDELVVYCQWTQQGIISPVNCEILLGSQTTSNNQLMIPQIHSNYLHLLGQYLAEDIRWQWFINSMYSDDLSCHKTTALQNLHCLAMHVFVWTTVFNTCRAELKSLYISAAIPEIQRNVLA